jgi:hypothetical protein
MIIIVYITRTNSVNISNSIGNIFTPDLNSIKWIDPSLFVKTSNFLWHNEGEYFSGIPDYFPDGYSSETLNYLSSGHFEVL